MGKTRDLFKKIRDTKGIFHAKMGTIKDRNSMDLTEAEDIKKRGQEYWSGRPFPSPGDLPHPGIKLGSLLHCRQILYHLSHAMEFLNYPQFSAVDTSTTNMLKRSKLILRETCPSHPPSK